MKFSRFIVLFAVLLLVSVTAFGQTGTTSNLTGTVTQDGVALPGVTVTISSPSMLGTRTAVTNENGGYNFQNIPPGQYTVRYELGGMQPVTRTVNLTLAATGRADAEMSLSSVAEAITVTAAAPAVLETTEVQTNINAELVENLPLGRTLQATTTLAPGVNTNGPNVGAITISGALAADNLFLVNGAVVNENLRGQPHNLFIEDAIQETTVQTAGVSAEYGRFLGGVVSAITKSGGNEFSGSFRDSFQNEDWTKDSPLGGPTVDTLNETYEATLGGRIIRDRLWFFGAGRYADRATPGTLRNTGPGQPQIGFDAQTEELRYEVKLTGQITPKHSLVGSYLNIELDQVNNCFIACLEFSNLDAARSLPNDFTTVRYNGVLTSNFLIEASYAEKNFAFEGSGGDNVGDRVLGTWFYYQGAFGGAPVFCGVCDPEERNNNTYGLKGTYYLATGGFGTHNVTAGYENWAESRLSNNYQSASGYGISISSGDVTRNADGSLTLTVGQGDYIGFFPIDLLSKGSDFVTDSVFVNDKWDLNNNLSFNLGVRYDQNDGKDSRGSTVADDSIVSPRLGAMYDILGNGKFRVNGSYSKYVNRIAETIGGSSSPAGNPSFFYYYYEGPELTGSSVDVIRGMFDWVDAQGGFDDLTPFAIGIPGFNTQIRESLVSPSVDEFTIGAGWQISSSAFLRADFIKREWNDFFVTRTDQSTGRVSATLPDDSVQTADLGLVENTDALERTYDAVQLQGAWRMTQRINVGGNYTYSETKGNQTGQTGGSGPISDAFLQYPEFKAYARNNPVGFLPQDQKHKARGWVSYDQPLGPLGTVNVSVLQNYDSGTPYSVQSAISTRCNSTDAGGCAQYVQGVGSASQPFYAGNTVAAKYLTPPTTVTYFFGDRGDLRFDDSTSTDLALNYTLPISRLNVFVQGELLNAFDEDAQTGGNTAVLTNNNASCIQNVGPGTGTRCARFNPFTTTPIEGVHFRRGPSFGQPTAKTTFATQGSFQLPQTYRVSVGLRF